MPLQDSFFLLLLLFCFVSHAHFFAMISVGCKCTESHILCVHIYATIDIYSLHRATPINPLLLQDMLPLQYARKYYSVKHEQQTYSLHEATPTFTSHIPVSASSQVAAPTDPSRYLFAIVCIHRYVRRYLQHVITTVSEHVPRLTNPGHIPVKFLVSRSTWSAVVTRFQCWCICLSL